MRRRCEEVRNACGFRVNPGMKHLGVTAENGCPESTLYNGSMPTSTAVDTRSDWNKGSQSRPKFADTQGSVFLDMVRGIAALMVLFGHARYFLYVDYPQVTVAHRALLMPFYMLCTLGHQAVIMFFVLSGYLVGGHVLRNLKSGKWSWAEYALQRGVRLYIALLPALALGAALDWVGLHFGIGLPLYRGQVANHMTGDVMTGLTLKALLGNLVFLQGMYVPVLGSNTPLWSLANEFWYYILFPLGLLVVWPGRRAAYRIGMGLLLLVTFAFAYKVTPLFGVWLMGAGVAAIRVRSTPAWSRWLAAVVFAAMVIGLGRRSPLSGLLTDYVLGAAMTGLLVLLLGAQTVAGQGWWVRASRTLAGFSYTLYVTHATVLTFVTAALLGVNRWQPDAVHLLLGLVLVLAIAALAYGIACLTEFRTIAVRKWFERRLLGTAH